MPGEGCMCVCEAACRVRCCCLPQARTRCFSTARVPETRVASGGPRSMYVPGTSDRNVPRMIVQRAKPGRMSHFCRCCGREEVLGHPTHVKEPQHLHDVCESLLRLRPAGSVEILGTPQLRLRRKCFARCTVHVCNLFRAPVAFALCRPLLP